MNEQGRQHYLQLMGITSYMPRAILPGALISPDYDIPECEHDLAELSNANSKAAIAEHTSLHNLAESVISASQKPSALSLVDSDVIQKLDIKQPSTDDEPKVSDISRQTVSFSYLLYEFEHCVAVCLTGSVDQPAYRHFIDNVFRALAVIPTDMMELHWPLSKSKALDHSLPAAQSYLRTAILASYTEKPLLIFGDLFEMLGLERKMLQLTCDESLSLDYFAVPCLLSVFEDASLKPSLWAALKQFHLAVSS